MATQSNNDPTDINADVWTQSVGNNTNQSATPPPDPSTVTAPPSPAPPVTAPTPPATPAPPTDFGNPVYNQIATFYQTSMGRAPTQQEVSQWGTNIDPTYLSKIQNQIGSTAEAQAYAKAQAAPPAPAAATPAAATPAAFDPNSWVTTALAGAKSTDDPGYWEAKIAADPNVQNPATRDSALAYWQGRINQGNGAGLGLPLFNDSAAPGSSSNTAATASSTSTPSASSPDEQALFNLLMGKAQQSLTVDPNDPIIKAQTDAAAATQTRQNRNSLNDMAEGSSPYATGAINNTATQLAETGAQNVSGLQGQLMQNELNSRRTEIQNALSESGSMLTAEDQLALQKELGLLNASINQQQVNNSLNLGQQQINSNNDQFGATYGLNSNYYNWLYSGGNG